MITGGVVSTFSVARIVEVPVDVCGELAPCEVGVWDDVCGGVCDGA